MFRQDRDYIHANNCLCLAAHKTDSSLLAYSIMSNHAHIGVRTEDPHEFMKAYRYPYNRYFNQRYGRKGMLGEKHFFQCEIDGLYHLLAAISYILRNALHHGMLPHHSVTDIPPSMRCSERSWEGLTVRT